MGRRNPLPRCWLSCLRSFLAGTKFIHDRLKKRLQICILIDHVHTVRIEPWDVATPFRGVGCDVSDSFLLDQDILKRDPMIHLGLGTENY